jgi:hypothetical protein
VSFDLVVWATGTAGTPDDVRAGHELCRQGHHRDGAVDRRIAAFHYRLTARYPDRGPSPDGHPSPWASAPLHVGADHVRMCLDIGCPDAVLETIERLAAEHDLMLLDVQDGSVYPPRHRVG